MMHPELKHHAPAYESLLLRNLRFVLDRYRKVDAYRFIDTKVNLITGMEFDPVAMGSPIYGRDIVFGYIQGRGLEALAGHLRWIQTLTGLAESEKAEWNDRIRTVLDEVTTRMEALRRRNRGRTYFMMDSDGTPLRVTQDLGVEPLNPAPRTFSFSDLFYAKGLYAAAGVLGRRDWRRNAVRVYRGCVLAVRSGTFIPGQPSFRREPAARSVEGGRSHGPYMIALGGIPLFLAGSRTPEWRNTGRGLMDHVVQRHVNRGRFPGLEACDFFECTDPAGQPWEQDGRILCDPGHALEFVGLACKYIRAVESAGKARSSSAVRNRYSALLSRVFRHVFNLGFNQDAGGICKSLDLISRRPIDDTMPWWNLPETLRAAALLLHLRPPAEHGAMLDIHRRCHDAFLNGYLNPNVGDMAFQTRSARGEPIDCIPAVPDADPCYHTGLSLIDVLLA